MKKPLVFTNAGAGGIGDALNAKIAIDPDDISVVTQPIVGSAGGPLKIGDFTQIYRQGVDQPIHVQEPYAQVMEMWLTAIADSKR